MPTDLRVLFAVIGHPLRLINGATNAARSLALAVGEIPGVNVDLAIMWSSREVIRHQAARELHFPCRSFLDGLPAALPGFVRIPFYRSEIPELIAREKYDLVHIHNMVPGWEARRVARACRRANVPFVVSTHGLVELSDYAAINRFGLLKTVLVHIAMSRPYRALLRDADRVFCLSEYDADLLRDIPVPVARTLVVRNGVDDFFLDQPGAGELAETRERFGLAASGPPVLFFMGSLHLYKGVDVFLGSLGELGVPFRAVVGGSLKPGQRERLLRDSRLDSSVATRITFTDRLTAEHLRALYNVCDVFVYPTRADTLPLVVLEAMAAGKPVVATRVGGIPLQVTPDTGILVPPGDSPAVARAVRSLILDEPRRTALGMAAKQRVKEVFTWPAAARCAVDAYRALTTS